MNKRWPYIVLGLLVAVIPFSGFPGAWKTVLSVAAGLLIAANAFLDAVRARARVLWRGTSSAESGGGTRRERANSRGMFVKDIRSRGDNV